MRRKKQGGGRRRVALGHAVPYRSCVACRKSAPRAELLRFARAPDGSVSLDVAARAGGRGAWTCPSAACVARAVERGAFERAFGEPVLGGAEALVGAVQGALALLEPPPAVAALFMATLSSGVPRDFSPGRLAHPRGRA